ncbi:MAG: polyribonucleotide nucleotidyltransferase [Verrucomicrobiota bacterium]
MSTATVASAQFGAHPIEIETGRLAKLADGAVVVRFGETVVLVTVVSARSIKEGQSFFPLTVEYRERAAAVGKIPGGYFKREGRPTEKEILTCRMTDRPLRPLFPKGYLYDTQIITTLLSGDGENDPDILSMNGASAALMVSDIPFAGPVGAVRVGRIDGQFVTNPTHPQQAISDLDLVYVGSENEIIMIEGSALEMPEADFKAALDYAQEQVQIPIALQKELKEKCGKPAREVELYTAPEEFHQIAREVAGGRINEAIYGQSKQERYAAVGALQKEVAEKIKEAHPDATDFAIETAFNALEVQAFRTEILDNHKRSDHRKVDEIRPLDGETGLLPRSHGSALFARGETQTVCLATLAPTDEAQDLDGYTGGETTKRFILHYNFPPFSVGETGRVGGLNRREIGHGSLAERSVRAVIPDEADFPYAIRVTSEVMESNGSTSMASICGGVLSLLDAGVPLTAPVAGISVGLVTEYEGKEMKRHTLLSDILGAEDHYGDMDFKLAGSRNGVTGFQLDLKLPGIPLQLIKDAIDDATRTRGQILDFMDTVISGHKTELSAHAPRIETLMINPDKIGLVIGPGGKNIKSIVAETGAEINIEDDGSVRIYCNSAAGMERAKEIIEGMVGEIEVDKIYRGRIVTVKEFGAFVECMPGKDGLVHISEWSEERVEKMAKVAKVGEEVWVKCIGIDDKGRCKLSRKVAMRERAQQAESAPAEPASA